MHDSKEKSQQDSAQILSLREFKDHEMLNRDPGAAKMNRRKSIAKIRYDNEEKSKKRQVALRLNRIANHEIK